MPLAMINLERLNLTKSKRSLLKVNFGGRESNPYIEGDRNKVIFNAASAQQAGEEETLLLKAGTQVGKILEGGTDVIVAPAKWLAHIQENWLIYIVCATVLMIGIFLIYCCTRRQLSSLSAIAYAKSNPSKVIIHETLPMAALNVLENK